MSGFQNGKECGGRGRVTPSRSPQEPMPYPCNVGTCDQRFPHKHGLAQHKRNFHRLYYECLLCIKKKKDKTMYRLDRKIDMINHFRNVHPNVRSKERSRSIRECSGRKGHRSGPKETGNEKNQSGGGGGKASQSEAPAHLDGNAATVKKEIPSTSAGPARTEKTSQGLPDETKPERSELVPPPPPMKAEVKPIQTSIRHVEVGTQCGGQKVTGEDEKPRRAVYLENEQLREILFRRDIDLMTLREERIRLEQKCRELEQKISSSSTETKGMLDRLSGTVKELKEQKTLVGWYQSQLTQRKETIMTLTSEVSKLQGMVGSLAGRCHRQENDIVRLKGMTPPPPLKGPANISGKEGDKKQGQTNPGGSRHGGQKGAFS